MQNYIQQHNKKLSYLKYRIGDTIRHQLKSPNSPSSPLDSYLI